MSTTAKKIGRMTKLLEQAADAFDDGRNPFGTEWLVEHDVTLEECMTLSQQIAVAVRNYARLSTEETAHAILRSITPDEAERRGMLATLDHVTAMRRAAQELAKA